VEAGVTGDDVVFTRTTDPVHIGTVKKLWVSILSNALHDPPID
jgi:hypothetical protein